ncbi:MAG: lysine exporter LysO family protein [bacterium]
MKNSLIIIAFFILGVLGALFLRIPKSMFNANLTLYSLYLLIFLIGISIGSDAKVWQIIKNTNIKIVLVPLSIIVGTLLGVILSSFFIKNISLKELTAVGCGFGYYTLSSILITKISSEALGVLALLSNIFREIITLLFAPVLVKYFGKLAPIASGGATSMDVTLPVITKFVGKEYAIISVFSGAVLTVVVPILITFILK